MNKLFLSLVELTILALAFTQMASAQTTWYVTTNGTGSGTSWADATNSIQDAINASTAGDTVLVSNGVYNTGGVTNYPTGRHLTNRVAISKAIIFRSANNDPANTIIEGAWDPNTTNGPMSVRCVFIAEGATMIGFTLRNGSTLAAPSAVSYDDAGGGVIGEIDLTVPITISNCVFTGNAAGANGGGAATWGAGTNVTLYDCTLSNNIASYGGGARGCNLRSCTVVNNTRNGTYEGTARDCTIANNNSQDGGGASYTTLYNCIVSNNTASQNGGGVLSLTAFYCTIVNNTIANSSGAGGGGAYNCTLSNCTVSGNTATNMSGGGIRAGIAYNCTISRNTATLYGQGGGAHGATLINCLIVGNYAQAAYGTYGGGGAFNSTLSNCTVVGNESYYGGGVHGGSVYNSIVYSNYNYAGSHVDPNWYNATVFSNSCTTPSNAAGWAEGNITNNPMLIDFGSGYGTNHVVGNYRLSNGSPCINSGMNRDWMNNSVDRDGRKRIQYGTVDMGAYEFIRSGTICGFH